MRHRLRTTGNRLLDALVGVVSVLACAVGAAACAGDDNAALATDAGASTATDATTDGPGAPDADARDGGSGAPSDGGHASAVFSSTPIDFGEAGCGAAAVTKIFSIAGGGTIPLAVSASTTGPGFSVTPTSLSLSDGGSGSLAISVTVPGSATAGTPVTGSLNLFTNDPKAPEVSIPLSATPTGATLAFPLGAPTTVTFPVCEVGAPAPPALISILNVGNAPAAISFGAPSSPAFSIAASDAGATTLDPGGTFTTTAGFFPTSTAVVTATSSIVATGALCGQSVSSLSFAAAGSEGRVVGYPSAPLDFGLAPCGGAAPGPQSFVLTNTGTVPVQVTAVSITGASGFGTNVAAGRSIAPNGGTLVAYVTAPAVPTSSSLTPLTATLSITTDASAAPILVTLTEEPSGAVLAFDTSPTPSFGAFGPIVLLGAASQRFDVRNTGNAAATVTLTTSSTADAGSAPFSVSTASVAVPGGGASSDFVVFTPTFAGGATGSLSMTSTGALCAPLPSPVPLSGVGLGGGPAVTPTALTFGATCGGGAPQAQSFLVSNMGSANMTWTLGAVTGPGAAQYVVTPTAAPGLLRPGEGTIVNVTAAAVPSPAPHTDPAAFAAQLTITTDVPLDPPHVVTLAETPLGDQLAFGTQGLRFGQDPIGSSISQPFTVINQANPGSPPASFTVTIQGAGARAYSVSPSSATNLAPNGGSSGQMDVTFAPPSAGDYPAMVTVSTSDPVCTALQAPLPMTGTGTQGKVLVSATSLAFGSDASDPSGLVDCGGTGLAHTFTVTNVGNQAFQVTGLSLGKGGASPFVLSGPSSALPVAIPIGGSAAITVTPNAIPANVADPGDLAAFSDTLTLTTDAALDAPHAISLFMQARGAVIADTPLTTSWSFGTIGYGSIGTLTSTMKNTGNAPVAVALQGLAQPSVFGIQNNPTTVNGGGVSAIVGQFVPPTANGSWTDQATLVVTPTRALCAPLPSQWSAAKITLSGASNGNAAVSLSGSLSFPTTDCGSAAPGGQAITLTNATNVPYGYTLRFNSGAYYAISNAGPGTVPPFGAATIVVTPKTVTPGPGVQPGSAPYADDLFVSVATPTPTSFTVPVSWTLDGAVLSLPEGAGPRTDALGAAFYPADSASGFALPMDNTGTATATVRFAIQPAGTFQFSPAAPIQVIPGIRATPELVSTASAGTCPATTNGTATFVYAGPICQPFRLPAIAVHSCVGAL